MSQAKSGDTVKIHYTGTLTDGTTFDSSHDREPLTFTLGANQVISGFEQAVVGMKQGERKQVNIAPGDAYGERNDRKVFDVPNTALPQDLNPEVGMTLQARGKDQEKVQLTVTAVKDETITVDANHPLAGETLNFDIELVKIV
jgi:peptidylprolyl isomerase